MRPPVALHAEVVPPPGDRIRWDAAAPDAGNRPISPAFETESGRGFGSGSVTLRRPTDRDYPELGLLNELILRSATGTIVYQGRARGIPVSDDFSFDCDGWISHGEQRAITDLIIDRETAAWGPSPIAERQRLASISPTLGFRPILDAVSQGSVLRLEIQRMTNITGAWTLVLTTYRAPGHIGKVTVGHGGGFGGDWRLAIETGPDTTMDNSTSYVFNSNSSAGTLTATPDGVTRFANIQFGYFLNNVADGPWTVDVTPTVYGQTGITTQTRPDGLDGFTASDGIRYLAGRYCPKWSTAGVQNSSYLIPHAVWREPTTPADAIRQLNSYHLWRLGVWEDRRLDFAPYDLSVADWQVQAGVDGVRVDYQGDTTENVYNGVSVGYTDFDGEQYRITPEDTAELRDPGDWIAANQWRDEVWLNIDVSWPCSRDDAVEIGRVALANANQARRPSTITVPAYIQDIHGTYWPSSYVRADQTILVTNQHSPVPRLITRTSWSDHSLTITTDDAIDTMEAFNQRISGALSSQGLI